MQVDDRMSRLGELDKPVLQRPLALFDQPAILANRIVRALDLKRLWRRPGSHRDTFLRQRLTRSSEVLAAFLRRPEDGNIASVEQLSQLFGNR